MVNVDDNQLLERWRGNDKQAGDALVSRHFQSVHRFFRNKVSRDVDDLVQQTFLACVEGRERFQQTASFRTYLFAIARFQLYAYYQRGRDRASLDFGTTSVRDLSPSPTGQLACQQDRRLLLEALRCIPVDMQIALELAYWEELSGPEIALVLSIPESTVYSRIRRARERLREALLELGCAPASVRHELKAGLAVEN